MTDKISELSPSTGKPFISVVIPTYKRRQRVEAAIRSIQVQTYSNWEIIVTDDEKPAGNTWFWLQKIAAADPRIHPTQYLDGHGQAGNTNHGMALAKGEWIKLLHDDDRLAPNCLAQLAHVAEIADEQVVLITTGSCRSGNRSDDHNEALSSICLKRYRGNEAIFGMYLQDDVGGTVPSAMMLRASVLNTGVKFENEKIIPSVIDIWFKVMLLTHGDLVHIDRPLLIKCEDDSQSITNTTRLRDFDHEYQLIRQMMQPFVDPALKPPSLKVVQGQIQLIRSMHRLKKRRPFQALQMAMCVWHPYSWWLAMMWGLRRLHPGWCNHVRVANDLIVQ